jgi:hypothetical protein
MNTIEIIDGQTFTVTILPTAKPKRSELVCSRVGGAKTRFYAATGAGRNSREVEKRIPAAGTV